MIRHAALLLLAAASAGCARRAPPEPPEPAAAPYAGGPIQVGRWGVGPIRALTYFESPRIRELFPSAVVTDGTARVSDDEVEAIITVAVDGVTELEIDDGTRNAPGTDDPLIGRVRAVGPRVRGPGGERVGMSWRDAGFDLSQCEIGVERDASAAICARQGDGQVTYRFVVPGRDSEELPSPSELRAKGYLSQILWTPPRPSRR